MNAIRSLFLAAKVKNEHLVIELCEDAPEGEFYISSTSIPLRQLQPKRGKYLWRIRNRLKIGQ